MVRFPSIEHHKKNRIIIKNLRKMTQDCMFYEENNCMNYFNADQRGKFWEMKSGREVAVNA